MFDIKKFIYDTALRAFQEAWSCECCIFPERNHRHLSGLKTEVHQVIPSDQYTVVEQEHKKHD